MHLTIKTPPNKNPSLVTRIYFIDFICPKFGDDVEIGSGNYHSRQLINIHFFFVFYACKNPESSKILKGCAAIQVMLDIDLKSSELLESSRCFITMAKLLSVVGSQEKEALVKLDAFLDRMTVSINHMFSYLYGRGS